MMPDARPPRQAQKRKVTPPDEYTYITIMKAYRWKGHQQDNAVYLLFEKRMSMPAVSNILGVPLRAVRSLFDSVPRRKKLYHWKRKPYMPSRWL